MITKEVTIQVLSILRKCMPPEARDGRMQLSLPCAATLGDLISHLELDQCLGTTAGEFLQRSGWQILVNGRPQREIDRILEDGDQVQVFPPMAGG